jgi:hypothetical protein
MSFGMKGIARDWGPGIVRVSGSFTVAGGAIVATGSGAQRPGRPGWTVARKAAGVYQVSLTQAFLSVDSASAEVGPATGFGNAAFPTAIPSGGFTLTTADFFTATATNLVPDPTNKNLVIITLTAPTGGAIGELTANYRCAFEFLLCESAVNK